MINSVRNTVLSVLNKNNYGYISPSDFNLYALQAQMEVYEEYFSNYNKTIVAENARTSGTDYSDINKALSETLEYFLKTDYLFPVLTSQSLPTGRFLYPSVTNVGNDSYMINKVVCYTSKLASGVTTSTVPYQLVDSLANFTASGISVGDIVINPTTYKNTTVSSIPNATTLILFEDIFVDIGSNEPYTIFSATKYREADKVTSGKITMLSNSSLTTPTLLFPAYTINSDYLAIYPSAIDTYGAVQATYFRYPKVPKWTYITLANGEPVFDQSQPDYQDFEMPNEDEFKLVMKILQYCGMSIREGEVVQFGMAQEQHEQPTFSQQQ